MEEFHSKILPSSEEQLRAKQFLNSEKMMEAVDTIKNNSGLLVSGTGNNDIYEQRMMIEIMSAVNNNEFVYLYSPVQSLSDKRVVKADCVLRWKHKTLGEIHPSVYMPVMESNGFITKMHTKQWDEACKTIKQWQDKGNHTVPITLKVSKTDLLALDIPEYMSNLISTYGIDPRDIEISFSASSYVVCSLQAQQAEKELLKKDSTSVCTILTVS